MGLRFRKSLSILPGLKLNIGRKSASVRVGMKGFSFTTGTAGQTVSVSLPVSGLSVTHKIKSSAPPEPRVPTVATRRRPWLVLVMVYAVAGLIWWMILHPK